MTPVWLEVHVDDVLLARDPARWPEAAALVDRIAAAAEAEGGRLSFRVRARFAQGDRGQFLVGLVRRGHEVGAHAHGKDLDAAVEALRAAGIAPTVFAPGFVQVGRRGSAALAAKARRLGAERLTDRVEEKVWTYQGWLARQHAGGLPILDVSVSPFAWGVLRRGARGVEPGRPDFAALAERTEVQLGWEAPPESTPFFGATVHEHDLAEPGTLRAGQLDGLRRYCARFRPVPSGSFPLRIDAVDPGEPPGAAWAARKLRGVRRRLWPTFRIDVGARSLEVRRVGPARPKAALVLVHAGPPGLRQGLGVLGLPEDAFPDLAVWSFARTPSSFPAPGNPVHAADVRAVVAWAAAEGVPVGLVSWSAGVLPALLSGVDAAFLVDVEGPADRLSLVPPDQPTHPFAAEDVHDDRPWVRREAVTLVRGWRRPYLRLQGTDDHQHHACVLHARRMVAAAPDGALVLVRGEVWLDPARARDTILQLVARVTG